MPPPATERDAADHAVRPPVRLRVFGTLRLEVDGTAVPLAPPRVETLLGALALAGGAPVRIDDLVDTLWPTDPPPSAVNQVHRLVGQARRLLDPTLGPRDAGTRLLGTGTSYRLALAPAELDLLAFREAAEVAREEPAATRLSASLAALRLAPAAPAAGLPADGAIGALARRIEQERIHLLLDGADRAQEDAGAALALLDVAEDLAARHPLDESVQEAWARLLLATGRRTLALEVVRATEDRLAAELGVGGGAGLKAVYVEALRADDDHADPSVSVLPLPVGLRSLYLPRPIPSAALDAAADEALRGGALAVVSGMGGIGKTTLVGEWCRANASRFHDGVLYYDARGMNPALKDADVAEVRTAIQHALGEPAVTQATAESYRAATRARELVLVLDNVPDADFVRALLPAEGHSLVIAISRAVFPGLIAREGAFAVPVDVLSDRESAELLGIRLGRQGGSPAPATIHRLVASCAGLPLALSIACARALGLPSGGLDALADQVESASRRLDLLSPGGADASVRATLSWSVDRLGPEASQLFAALSMHPGASCSIETAESLLGSDAPTVNAAIAELLSASLLSVDDEGRLRMHDLVRELAAERLDAPSRAVLERRLVHHFVRTARVVMRITLGKELDIAGVEPGAAEAFDTTNGVTAWYFAHKPLVAEVIWLAIRRGDDLEAALLGTGFSFMLNRMFWPDRDLPLFEALLAPARRTGSPAMAISAINRVATRYESLGRFAEAEELWRESEDWARNGGTDIDLSDTTRGHGASMLHRRDRDLDVVIGLLEESVVAARRGSGMAALAMGLTFYGDALRQAGRLEEAAAAFTEIGATPEAPSFYRAVSYGFLATTLLSLERLPEAIDAARISIRMIWETESVDIPTLGFQIVATACLRLGDRAGAAEACADFRRAWSPEALEASIARQEAAGEDVLSPFAIAPIAAEISRVERELGI